MERGAGGEKEALKELFTHKSWGVATVNRRCTHGCAMLHIGVVFLSLLFFFSFASNLRSYQVPTLSSQKSLSEN
jgi:hypothetical protein